MTMLKKLLHTDGWNHEEFDKGIFIEALKVYAVRHGFVNECEEEFFYYLYDRDNSYLKLYDLENITTLIPPYGQVKSSRREQYISANEWYSMFFEFFEEGYKSENKRLLDFDQMNPVYEIVYEVLKIRENRLRPIVQDTMKESERYYINRYHELHQPIVAYILKNNFPCNFIDVYARLDEDLLEHEDIELIREYIEKLHDNKVKQLTEEIYDEHKMVLNDVPWVAKEVLAKRILQA